jgi:hypothetical protein
LQEIRQPAVKFFAVIGQSLLLYAHNLKEYGGTIIAPLNGRSGASRAAFIQLITQM